MTFKEFEEDVLTNILPNRDEHLRAGQAIMIHLFHVWPNEYYRITENRYYSSSEMDCFTVDRRIPKTLKHLEEKWVNYPE